MEKELTEREAAFAREYVLDHNGTRAAIRAGYAKKNAAVQASRMLKKERVRARIDQLEKELAAAFGLSAESLINRYAEIYERCMAAKPVMEWDRERREYVESGLWTFDARGAIRALSSLAALAGLGKKNGEENGGYEQLLEELEHENETDQP